MTGPCSQKNRIRLPKQKRLPEALSDHQVRQLLASVRSPTHRTCLLVMYGCGLRIGEAVRLEVGAVDSEHGVLRIVAGKGGRDRRVSLPLSVLEALRALWRTHRHPRWLFPNRRGTGPVDTDVVAATFRAAAAEAGIRDRVTAHVLRHSYATRLLEQGVDIRVVQILLGHRSIASTAHYTHLTEPTRANLRRILDRIMRDL